MNFFKRDILVLLLVSVILGTALAKLVSYGANVYFQETLVSLVGDYGEYDLVLQMREDYDTEAKVQLETVLKESFDGATYKEGPKIIGKANFFIALPKNKKNQAVYENLDRLFANVPGVSGVSILTEPRLNIRGIPPGAVGALEEEFKAVEGVNFVYRSGSSIGIILNGIDKIAEVTNKVEKLLIKNKIIDVSFPVGVEPDNPVMLAENISKEIHHRLKTQLAQYVSVDTSNDDMIYLISTMQEIRKFLLTYATKVNIVPKSKGMVAVGDKLVFQGSQEVALVEGAEINRSNIVVMVTEVNKDGSLNGIITQGDVAYFQNKDGYSIKSDKVGSNVASVSVKNPRIMLVKALEESAGLMEKMPVLADEGNRVSKKVNDTLSLYAQNSEVIKQSIENMDNAVLTMQIATERLENANIKGLKNQIDQSLKSINGLLSTLKLISVFNSDVASAVENLKATQEKMQSFSELLDGVEGITQDARKAKNVLVNLSQDGKSAIESLDNFDESKAKTELNAINKQLNDLVKMDFKQFAAEMRYLANQAPKISDEEIYRSVQLMDKVIEGQIIPGKRLQIMVDRGVDVQAVRPIVYQILGHENASVYETDLGVIEPNIYLQVYQVLKEVQAVLAGFTAVVMTIVFLALDHTAVMSVLRKQRRASYPKKKNIIKKFFYVENIYGIIVGGILLSLTFFFSGAGIPYVKWYVIPLIGMMIGYLMARLTEKITPVSADEILAGQSLGMSFDEIMREIIIPNARPGLLQRLNRKKLSFK